MLANKTDALKRKSAFLSVFGLPTYEEIENLHTDCTIFSSDPLLADTAPIGILAFPTGYSASKKLKIEHQLINGLDFTHLLQ